MRIAEKLATKVFVRVEDEDDVNELALVVTAELTPLLEALEKVQEALRKEKAWSNIPHLLGCCCNICFALTALRSVLEQKGDAK